MSPIRLKVLISTSTFPTRPGEVMPRFVYDLALGLAEHCQVYVLAPSALDLPRQEKAGAVQVERFTYFWPPKWQRLAYGEGMRENIRCSLLARFQSLPYIAAQVLAIRQLVRRKNIHVVNSHWLVPQGLSSALALGTSRQCAHVLTVHAADVYLLHGLPGGRQVARFVKKRSDSILAAGSHVRESLDRLLGYSSGAILQPMGVRNSLFTRTYDEEPVESPFPDGYLLFFGRLVEKKGVAYLLEVMPSVVAKRPGLGLIIIGTGPLESQLRQQSRGLGLEDRVFFAGRKPHTEIARYLHGCRAAVVPSIVDRRGETEGMPTVLIEAMAAGCRVVGSNVNGIPDVLTHCENGWLCREKDPADLADKIEQALKAPADSAVVSRAVETAKALDWAQVAKRYLEVLASAAIR